MQQIRNKIKAVKAMANKKMIVNNASQKKQ